MVDTLIDVIESQRVWEGTLRPNFLFFITDQHRADWLGCNGHPILRTPHIDAIASQGISFNRFYVASPVCMPTRASLMTGRMPSVHGVRANGTPLSTQSVTFVDLLLDAGYETALIGKSHLQTFTGLPPLLQPPSVRDGFAPPNKENIEAIRHGLDSAQYKQESPDFWSKPGAQVKTPYYGFSHVELVTGHGDGVDGDYRSWLMSKDKNAMSLIGSKNQLPHDYQCPQAVRTRLPSDLYQSNYIAERARAFIESHKIFGDERPFFLFVSFPDPHHPFNPPGKYWDMYKPEQFPVPRAFLENNWEPPPHVGAVLAEREKGIANLNSQFSFGATPREAQEAAALTAGMISLIDDAIGSVTETLERNGFKDNTVIIFNSDHGEHLGDHRLMLKGSEQYQQILRVPFIWSDPVSKSQTSMNGIHTDALGSAIDISATILERAKVAPCVGMQGISLLSVIEGHTTSARDYVFIQYDHQRINEALGGVPRVHTLIDQRWRLSIFDGVEWGELYDLENDPDEMVNLWDCATAREFKTSLIERLAREQIRHVDRVPMPIARA